MFRLSPQFRLTHKFEGPQDAVLSLSCSENARFLAASGFNGVAVWEVDTLSPVVVPEKFIAPRKSKYMPSACTWIYFQNPGTYILLLGTLEGKLLAWKWNKSRKALEAFGQATATTPAQVTSIHVESPSTSSGGTRVVAAFADHTAAVWKLKSHGTFKHVYTVTLPHDFLPKAVFFERETGHVYAFALNGGAVALLSRKDGSVLWRKDAAPESTGSVAVDSSYERFVIGTGKDFQVFDTIDLRYLRTLESSGPVIVPYPMQLAFTEDNTQIVTGTDSGQAVLCNVDSGKIVQRLHYPKGGLVQTVTTFATREHEYIVLAGSSAERSADVLLWRKKRRTAFWETMPFWLMLMIATTAFILASVFHLEQVRVLDFLERRSIDPGWPQLSGLDSRNLKNAEQNSLISSGLSSMNNSSPLRF
ncbi:hypothetical protein AAF712_008653 [Marasmius tenuissimus]|uniref:WD40 repeat-like protein n=1 Tax=Marasmius tenuissimus TaxID=585030 RepID=A0ABR2ZUA0_9AGAR